MTGLRRISLRRLLRALHSDRGSVAISFLFAFPIFLVIVSIIVQYALLVNAKTMVQHAAESAARAAATALPDQQPDAVLRAARFSLVPLSPKALGAIDDEASATADALRSCGVNIADSFAERYTYAKEATRVGGVGGDYLHAKGRHINVTVYYRFQLTVPFAGALMSRNTDNISGVSGRFFELNATAPIQTSHGRQTYSHGDGWPY